MARYYRPVSGETLLGGARTGIVAYLHRRGIADPAIPLAPPHVDKWGAENAIDRDVALALARYGDRVRTPDLIANTIAGELGALHDPYTVLFRPAALKKFVGFLDGSKTGGIGAELDVDPRTHAVRVVDVFPGDPAERAGLLSGDVITSIDGDRPAAGMPDAVSSQLRGAPGTRVRIGFTRDGVTHPPVAIVRAAIEAPDVIGRMLPNAVGYVRVRSFGARSAQQFDSALARLRAAHPHAYVLDLRGDGGGYRDGALAIASHLVDGTIVTTRERGAAPQVFRAKAAAKLDAPFAVLVDGDTASAAEIVAGAVQDERAGTIVGTKTFGKGLVQEVFPMPGGAAIKVTTASYLTPQGRDIEGVGITPDVVIAQPSGAHLGEAGHDPQLDRALSLLAASPSPTR
jgi:carboxyl-terminal processing protease